MLTLMMTSALLFGVIHGDVDCGNLDPGPFTGEATFFDADTAITGQGKCTLTADDKMVAGIAQASFQNSQVCGECIDVTGPSGNTVSGIKVIDECSGCSQDGVNLSEEVFAMLADVNLGIISVTWSVVMCSVTGNIRYRFKDGSSQYWFAIQASNIRYPISQMQLQKSGTSSWIDLERQDYNFFLKPNSEGAIAAPFDIKLTSTNGFVVEETIDTIYSSESQYIEGTSQFTSCSSDSTVTTLVTGSSLPTSSDSPGGSVTATEAITITTMVATPQEVSSDGGKTESTTRDVTGADVTTQDDESCRLDDQVHHGEGTYYLEAPQAANGLGTCMLNTNGDLMVGAMAISSWKNSQVCGECVEVTGPDGDVIHIQIIDQCPTCPGSGDIDFSEEAFELLAPKEAGRIDISWRVVECPLVGNFKYKFKDGSTQWWFGIQVNNHRYPVNRVQLKKSEQSDWIDLERTHYNFFLKPNWEATIDVPFDIRVTSTNGFAVEDTISRFLSSESQVLEGSTQFPACNGQVTPGDIVTPSEEEGTVTSPPEGEGFEEIKEESADVCYVDSQVHTGQGTYYLGAPLAAAGSGTCMMNTGGNLMVGAMAVGSWENSEACGKCIEVTGPYGDVVHIIIVDQCPSCAYDDIDLSLEAFEKLADISEGRIQITWKVIECPFTRQVNYKFKEGSTKWWFGIQVVFHRVAVESVAIRPAGEASWTDLSRSTYNFFLKNQGIVDVPFDICITSSTGEVLEDTITYFPSSLSDLHPGQVQFTTSCEGADLYDEDDYNTGTTIILSHFIQLIAFVVFVLSSIKLA